MNGLSNKELAQMRQDVESLYPDVCHLITLTQTSDGQGGYTETWGTATKNVPCRMDALVGSERLTDGSMRSFAAYELTIPYDTVITGAYRVEHGGYTYHVLDANVDQSWQIERAVLVERVS